MITCRYTYFIYESFSSLQAALGPVALDEVRKMTGAEPDPVLMKYAETVVTVCIMSIVITAPIGAIVITLTGPKLLSRTTKPPVLEGNVLIAYLFYIVSDLFQLYLLQDLHFYGKYHKKSIENQFIGYSSI